MGTNTIGSASAHSNGDIIDASHINDLIQAMNGAWVGRNSSGVPTAGQSLGSVAFPYGSAYVTSLIINGSAIDTSQISAPANHVISGLTRSTSNHPTFIQPNGSTNTVVVKAGGSNPNLSVSINGSTVDITSDITKTGLSTPPTSNNTCLVNDTDAANQEDTRLWGEINHRKDIAIDTIGSEISSLVGTYQSFKINDGSNDEYFYAFVEAAALTKAFRGYFYNSTYSPINRIKFADGDTITLMKTGYIFVEDNGTTADITYNRPSVSYAALSSPATGDYWYDLGNDVWKRYSGVSWETIDRTYIGMVILDESGNAVGARCDDFYKGDRPDNSIELEPSTTEIVKAIAPFQRVMVNGTLVDFKNGFPQWNITTDLATSADMYNASEQSSTMYYLYIKDTGETVISDISPYVRQDKFGKYHPHNSDWRCVGLAYNDNSSDINQANELKESHTGNVKRQIKLLGGNGRGSTWTYNHRFANVSENTLASIVYIDSSVDGTSFTCFEEGSYSFQWNCEWSANAPVGLAVNATYGATTVSIANFDRMSHYTLNGQAQNTSSTFDLKVGDVVYPHGSPYNQSASTASVGFFVERIR